MFVWYHFLMTTGETWPTPNPEPEPQTPDDDLLNLDEMSPEEIEAIEREIREENERERQRKEEEERLSHPQRITIDNRELKELLATGETVLPNVDLYKRELELGEEIILEDENLKEYKVQFVKMERPRTKNAGAKVRVKLQKEGE